MHTWPSVDVGPTSYCLKLICRIKESQESDAKNYGKIINLFTNHRLLCYIIPVLCFNVCVP